MSDEKEQELEIVRRQPLLHVGKFNNFYVTKENLEDIKTFFDSDPVDPAIVMGHTYFSDSNTLETQQAWGWVTKLEVENDTLFFDAEVFPELSKAVKQKKVKFMSGEWAFRDRFTREDGSIGFRKGELWAVAMLGKDRPADPLARIMFSASSALSGVFGESNYVYFSEVQSTNKPDLVTLTTPISKSFMKTEVKPMDTPDQTSDQSVLMDNQETELVKMKASLTEKETELTKLKAEVESSRSSLAMLKEITPILASSMSEGRVTPAEAKELLASFENLSSEQKVSLKEGLSKLPVKMQKTPSLLEEISKMSQSGSFEKEKVAEEIQKFADDKKMSYGEAAEEYFSAHPEIAKKYFSSEEIQGLEIENEQTGGN